MKVYCGHPLAQPYKGPGGYIVCGLCGSEWYSIDPAPIVVLGYTEIDEVPKHPYYKKRNDL